MLEKIYAFIPVDKCNMCGAESKNFRILGRRMNSSQGKSPRKKAAVTTTVMQCRACDLIFSNPQPIPYNLQEHYGVEPEEYWREDYFQLSDTYFRGELNWLNKLKPVQPGMKALDIGAGLGKAMISMEKAGLETYGFEPSEPFYRRAIDRMGISPDRLKLSAMEEAEFEENFFDFITFGAVLEHLYNPSESIRKAMRWLKPDGLIHIEVPSSRWLINRIANFYYRLTLTEYVANISPMHTPFHLYEFSIRSFRLNGEINNYGIADHGYYICETFMPKVLDPMLRFIMGKTNTGMQLCVWLRKNSAGEILPPEIRKSYLVSPGEAG